MVTINFTTMKTHILILIWLFCAQRSFGQDWIKVESYEANIKDVYFSDETVRPDDTLIRRLRSVTPDTEDLHSVDSEKTEVVFDEEGKPRDKRTLGLIVQGLASALGYTLTPLQIASLPNPSAPPVAPPAPPAPKAPVAPSAPKAPPAPPKVPAPAPPPNPSPPVAPPAKAPAPSAQPRQRETIRLTGLVNFGSNANGNLPAQLGQYEQLFHGNAIGAVPGTPPARPSAPVPAPAPAPTPKPTLAKIPSPIVPNLAPLLPPMRPPASMPGSTPTKPGTGSPMKQKVETEYRNKEDLEKYNVESKEIFGGDDLNLESPRNRYNQDAYVQEPDWREGYNERLKELEERQKEYSDKLKQHENLLVKQQQEHEDTDQRFANREQEIVERNRAHTSRLRNQERERDSQKNEEGLNTEAEDSREEYEERNGPSEGLKRPLSSESEEEHPKEYELEEEKNPKQYSEYDEEPKKYVDYDDFSPKYSNYDSEDGEKLPIARDKENLRLENVRNSYGESLEDRGQIDENIADYFVKFKDSKTGLYVPEKTQNGENYNKEKEPWWKQNQEDFEGRIENLMQEYSSPAPESKYEEYELEEKPEENSKTAEKFESDNESEEPTHRSNEAQKFPDYSEAFGGSNEPYLKKLEPERNQGILRPSTDTVENPRSELNHDSNDESEKESEKSEDKKDIPFYHFDFKSFMPYYSPIKYVYGSDNAESGISRIQSYNQNSEVVDAVEPTKEELLVESKELNEEHQPKIGLPEKLTIKNLHDGESKELHAWPAPFDYVFDSTEQTNVAELPQIQAPSEIEVPVEVTADEPYPNEGLQATPVSYLVPEYDTEIQNQQGIRQEQNEPESFHGHLVRTHNLQEHPNNYGFYEYFRPSSAHEDASRQSHVSNVPATRYNPEESNAQITYDQRSPQNVIKEQRYPQAPELKNHRYSSSEYPFANHQRDYETNKRPNDDSSQHIRKFSSPSTEDRTHHQSRQQYQPVKPQYHKQSTNEGVPILQNESNRQFGPGNIELRNRGKDFSQNYTPIEPRLSGRRFDGNPNNQPQEQSPHPEDKSSVKFEDPQSAHDFFGFSQNDYDYENNKKIDKLQEIKETPWVADNGEVLDLLVVSDPTPYQYDEMLTKFTDEPESDTEKVKVKEYRNKVATVTVSERKQLSPEGPVQLIGYTHQY